MSETKIQINARKIRNSIRKEAEAREELMWQKLSTVPGDNTAEQLRGMHFSGLYVDEWVK